MLSLKDGLSIYDSSLHINPSSLAFVNEEQSLPC